jgi:hypothetical protein
VSLPVYAIRMQNPVVPDPQTIIVFHQEVGGKIYERKQVGKQAVMQNEVAAAIRGLLHISAYVLEDSIYVSYEDPEGVLKQAEQTATCYKAR